MQHFGLDLAATKCNPGLDKFAVLTSAIVDDMEAFGQNVLGRSVHALEASPDPSEAAHLQA